VRYAASRFADSTQSTGAGRGSLTDIHSRNGLLSADRGGARPRPARQFFVALVAAFVAAGLFAAAKPALAITSGHALSFEFGSAGAGNGQFEGDSGYGLNIGIDQSNGDVYVADSANHRIEKFDASGNFLAAWGYGVQTGANTSEVCTAPSPCRRGLFGAAPGQLEWPNGIAVDNSGGPNDGDVYVVDNSSPFDQGLRTIAKFNSDGTYLATIDGSETPTGPFPQSYVSAAAVDGNGFLWVTTSAYTMRFSNEAENEYVVGSEWEGGGYGLGVNAAGTKLYLDNHVVGPTGANPQPSYTQGVGAWVNQANGDVFAIEYPPSGEDIQEYTDRGEPVGPPFGSHPCVSIFGSGGMAVNEGTNTVYVVDPCDSKVLVFKPRTVPDITTGPAMNVSHASATLTGQVAPDPSGGGDVSSCHFELGTDTSYGTSVPCVPATPYSAQTAVTADVSGLTMDTPYHYRLVAGNSIDSNKGVDKTFIPRRVLGLNTEPATNIGQSTATVNGSFDAGGLDTHYFFEWGSTNAYGNVTSAPPGLDAGSPAGSTSVSAVLSGLAPYGLYHFRVIASNSLGTSYGADETVRTNAPTAPIVGDATASSVTDTTAQLSTTVNPNLSPTIFKFQYGTHSTYGRDVGVNESIGEDQSNHPAAADLVELQPGTTYHFRIVATNFGGTTHGPDMTFTTTALPGIESADASHLTSSGAMLEARVDPERSPTTVHFEYGPTVAYGSSTAETAAIGGDSGAHSVIASVGGLAAATTYHFRVVATNEVGVTRSVDQTFTTTFIPRIEPKPPHRCGKGRVRRHGKCVKKPKHKKQSRHRGHRGA
jgi:phosphodiesterase/alkaline phosphatase D-like protein